MRSTTSRSSCVGSTWEATFIRRKASWNGRQRGTSFCASSSLRFRCQAADAITALAVRNASKARGSLSRSRIPASIRLQARRAASSSVAAVSLRVSVSSGVPACSASQARYSVTSLPTAPRRRLPSARPASASMRSSTPSTLAAATFSTSARGTQQVATRPQNGFPSRSSTSATTDTPWPTTCS